MNSEQQQQRIMGYFIEEAREHLQTIEQGVLNLQDVLNDSESVNELFRAAHSIKGGSAMLGVGSIQHVAHRLEDFFKILTENPQITVDERLKSLLLAGFDPLSELLDALQGGYKISDELTTETNNRVKPVFAELESYLHQLVSNTDGVISAETIGDQAEKIPQPQELVVSKKLVFQQEVTTKMRDMLQLFRATDNAESRSQLQAVCNYFQEVGNNFDLQNWTNLVTQIKNAIAQPSNAYRTLAPILIRELKEAQDLVLANRELEIAVSLQLQNLLPYKFSEPEDDEVSTIFGAIGEDVNTGDFDISDTSITSTDGDLDLNPDVDLDLFADQVNEEVFDLSDTHKNQVDQMGWTDSEYEITEDQHIDGPKVGASELKSLAILFENDDIDFDAAWEDIESNETNIANHGATETSDSHDEFADLLGNNSDNNDVTDPNLSSGESSIDQLFGEFSDQDLGTEEDSNSLFPDDLDDSWEEIPDDISGIISEIIPEREQASLDSLFTDNFATDESLDNQFDLDLGMDIVDQTIVDQVSDEQIDEDLSIDRQFGDVDISQIDVEENSFSGLPDQVESSEQLIGEGLSDIDDSHSLSSEEYFAAIAIAENEISDHEDDSPSEPFALTFSEEDMDLLDDPFALSGSLDEVFLEASPSLINDEDINADVDNFFEDSAEIASNNYTEAISENDGSDGIDTTGLNVFDELGFDNDKFDETSQDVIEETNLVSDIPDNFDLINEGIESIEDPISIINNAEFDDSFYTSPVDEATSNFADFNEDNETNRAINDADDLADFFAGSEEPDVSIDVNDELEAFTDIAGITEESDDFFGNSEESEVDFSSVSDSFEQEFANTEELGDFFTVSDTPETSSDIPDSSEPTYESNNTESLGDFFSASEAAEIGSSDRNELDDYANAINNADDLGDFFFDEVEESQSLAENISNDDSDEFSTSLTNINNFDNVVDTYEEEQESFIDFDSPQDINSDFSTMGDEGLVEATPLTQADDINDLTSMLDDDLQDASLKTVELELANTQGDQDLEDNDASAQSTIDNLADFFQVDDNSEVDNLLQNSEQKLGDSNLTDDTPLDFGEFNEFVDLDEDISELEFSLTQSPETKNLESEQQLQTEELNGIDDNFDFDDLEAMIGNSSNMPDEVNSVSNRTFDAQITTTVINDLGSAGSNDMNFDELEALLGESNSFDDNEKTKKANDEFDELENMLQNTFAPEVGKVITKASTRQPATTRKPKLTDSTMRVDVKYLDSLNNLVGELVVNRNLLEQDQERLQQFITNLLHQVQLLSDVSQRMRDQYDRSLLEASLTAGRGGRSSYSFDIPSQLSDGANSNSSVTNDFEGIEFDRYNTFHVLSQEIIELIVRVRESASDIEFVVGETDQVTRQLGTITTQVQDDLKQSRMVPFAQIADRLPRGIRDRALKTGKQAELEIFGRETLIDKAILEQLTDPLTHLVNNAIDHGLEDPSTRKAAGKSATGKLTVRAYHQGNQTVISIGDDGAGISTDKVKKSAVSKGVRSQSEVDRLNENEVYALLFEAGFSTAVKADEFKGRGVGLDVVKTCLDEIRGVIIVESVVGKGTTFTIRLPLTLSISKAMFCISDRARIAFPVDGFEDMVEVPQSQIVLNEKGNPCLPWRDTVLPFQHLSNLLSYSRHLSRSSIYGKQENDELCIIILRNDTSYLALQVDQFLGEYEIVIKQLEGPIPQPAGIAGATVLGDGRVMAIANVLELFDIASGRLRPSTSGLTIQPTVEEDIAADPTVLIVDDSITVRELLSLTFAKVGYRVEQAKDGQDAWEKLRAGLPCDMIFCDIEMPRMDGLDLLSRLQKDARLKDIPVAMLTSRGADRHRQSAIQLGAKGYFTKPYLEEELLSASKRLLAGETLPI
jgi:chemotaxis protein histidine kinase CheA/CheY-like chemotaxis protein